MRLVEYLPKLCRRAAFETLLALQETATLGYGDPLLPLSHSLCNLGDRIRYGDATSRPGARAAARSLYALGRCVRCVWAESSARAESFTRAAIVWAERAIRESGRDMLQELRQDAAAIFAYADELGPEYRLSGLRGGRDGKFSQDIFAPFALFNTEVKAGGYTILELSPVISGELIARLAEHPRLLHELHPREFEEIVARVFASYGFEVELTGSTRDGGRDVIAIGHEPARVKYLIECKRYAPTNTVGIAVVQRLHGVMHGDSGSKAIVATTSGFTKPTLEYMARPHVQYLLEGRDFEGVHRWLLAADRMRLARHALGTEFTMTASGLVVPTC